MSLLEYELDYFLFIVDQNYRIFIENSEAMGFFKIPFLFDKLKMKRVFFSYMLIWHLEKNVLKWGVGIKPHLTGFQNPWYTPLKQPSGLSIKKCQTYQNLCWCNMFKFVHFEFYTFIFVYINLLFKYMIWCSGDLFR